MKTRLESFDPKLFQELINRKSEFVSDVIKLAKKVEIVLETEIPKIFPYYTLHNTEHSLRIMNYMFELIPNICEISDLEIVILIYSALLHDIGMSVSTTELDLIYKEKYVESNDRFEAVLRDFEGDTTQALQEFIRKIHAKRSAKKIREDLKEYMKLPDQEATYFYEEVASICESHTEDGSWITDNLRVRDVKGKYRINSIFCAILLRIGDILDIDSQRTPPYLRKLIKPTGISESEWAQHFVIHNQDKVITDEITREKSIVLYGECRDSLIHRKIFDYVKWIDKEILNANMTTKSMGEKYNLNIKYPLENNIKAIGYRFSESNLSLDFKAVTHLLMGERIYGSKKLGLRELIQNSMDACFVLKEIEDKHKKPWEANYVPSIKVVLDKNDNKVMIKDNGLGMSLEILEKYFLNVGVSYYNSKSFKWRNYEYAPVGNYGIGFLACFMLTNSVLIKTKHYTSTTCYEITLVKGSEYICINESTDPSFNGTEITLEYDGFMRVFGSEEEVFSFISTNFLTDEIQIEVYGGDHHDSHKPNNSLQSFSVDTWVKPEWIDVSKYMEGVEGSILVNVKRSVLGNGLADLPGVDGTLIYYDGMELIEITDKENFKLDQIIRASSRLDYIKVPIISDEHVSEYETIRETIDDDERILDLIKNNVDELTIYFGGEVSIPINNEIIEEGDDLLENVEFEELEKFGQILEYPTMRYQGMFLACLENGGNRFIPLEQYGYNKYSLNVEDYPYEVYVRNIKIPDFEYFFNFGISYLEIVGMKLNIKNRKVIPDISRNELVDEDHKALIHAINAVVCKWYLETYDTSQMEIKLINQYLEEFLVYKSLFMRT